MPGEIENAARSMMSSPQGLKLIKGLDKYNAAMNRESGRQAAAAARGAPRDPGRVLLQNLLSSKDGAALAAKAIEVMGV